MTDFSISTRATSAAGHSKDGATTYVGRHIASLAASVHASRACNNVQYTAGSFSSALQTGNGTDVPWHIPTIQNRMYKVLYFLPSSDSTGESSAPLFASPLQYVASS